FSYRGRLGPRPCSRSAPGAVPGSAAGRRRLRGSIRRCRLRGPIRRRGRAPRAGPPGLLRLRPLLLVGVAAVVGDVEARALEEQPRASRRHPLRATATARAASRPLVLDAVEDLEPMFALRTAVIVRRHAFILSSRRWLRTAREPARRPERRRSSRPRRCPPSCTRATGRWPGARAP